jgi:hypothetical protein
VDKRRQGGDEDGIFRFRVDEVAKLILAVFVAAGDAHDITVVLVAKVLILVHEGLAHAGRVFLVQAVDNCLLESRAAFLQEVGDLLGGEFGAVV